MNNKLHVIFLSSSFDYIALEENNLSFPNFYIKDTISLSKELKDYLSNNFPYPKIIVKRTLNKLGPKIFLDEQTNKLSINYYLPLLIINNGTFENHKTGKRYVWNNPYNMRLSSDFIVKNYYDNFWLEHIKQIRKMYFSPNLI